MCTAVIYTTLCTAVVAVIIFIIIVIIAIHLLALCHCYAAACKLHRAPLHSSPFGGNFLCKAPPPPCHHTCTAHVSYTCITFSCPTLPRVYLPSYIMLMTCSIAPVRVSPASEPCTTSLHYAGPYAVERYTYT